MESFNLNDFGVIFGICATILCGINFIIISIAKVFWNLTFNAHKDNCNESFAKVYEKLSGMEECMEKIKEKDIKALQEAEIKNATFRHNFDAVTKNLLEHISSEIKHIEKHFDIVIKSIREQIKQVKE